MNSDELEQAYDQFLDSCAYDCAESLLFDLVRQAFVAGWYAAKRDSITLIDS